MCELVALRDLRAGDEVSVCWVGDAADRSQRHEAVACLPRARRRAGVGDTSVTGPNMGGASATGARTRRAAAAQGVVCACMRCRLEGRRRGRMDGGAWALAERESVRAMAALYMQQGRHEEAFAVYAELVERAPADADALHARAGALLEGGWWPEAHLLFRLGAELAPTHPGLALHAAKEAAYGAGDGPAPATAGGTAPATAGGKGVADASGTAEGVAGGSGSGGGGGGGVKHAACWQVPAFEELLPGQEAQAFVTVGARGVLRCVAHEGDDGRCG